MAYYMSKSFWKDVIEESGIEAHKDFPSFSVTYILRTDEVLDVLRKHPLWKLPNTQELIDFLGKNRSNGYQYHFLSSDNIEAKEATLVDSDSLTVIHYDKSVRFNVIFNLR
jgi:hypothetical protein